MPAEKGSYKDPCIPLHCILHRKGVPWREPDTKAGRPTGFPVRYAGIRMSTTGRKRIHTCAGTVITAGIPSNIAAINDIRELRAIVPGVTINRGCHRQSETYTEYYIDDGSQEHEYQQQGIEDHRFTPMARLFRTIIALNSPLR